MNDLCDLLSSVDHKRWYFESQWGLNNIGPRWLSLYGQKIKIKINDKIIEYSFLGELSL